MIEIAAPFNPTSATERVANALKSYRLTSATGVTATPRVGRPTPSPSSACAISSPKGIAAPFMPTRCRLFVASSASGRQQSSRIATGRTGEAYDPRRPGSDRSSCWRPRRRRERGCGGSNARGRLQAATRPDCTPLRSNDDEWRIKASQTYLKFQGCSAAARSCVG